MLIIQRLVISNVKARKNYYYDITLLFYPGFTEEIGMKKHEWDNGFLKSYQDATLMYCSIHAKINYLEVSRHLRQQRLAFLDKIKTLTNRHLIYSGPVKEFQRGLSPINLENLQGLKEAGWDPTAFRELLSPESQREIYLKNETLLELIKEDKDISWPFMGPVAEQFPEEAEKYSQAVQDPIDLRTIDEKLKAGFYITHEMLVADLRRMVLNCQEYNQKNSIFWEYAERINTRYLKSSITEVVVGKKGKE